jgi:hypothetical protein
MKNSIKKISFILFLSAFILSCKPKGSGYKDFDFIHMKPSTGGESKYKNVYCLVEGNKTTLSFGNRHFSLEKFKEFGDSIAFYTGNIFDFHGEFEKDLDTMITMHDSLICIKRHYAKIGNGVEDNAVLLWYKNGNKIVCDMGCVYPELNGVFSKPASFYFEYLSRKGNIKTRKTFEVVNESIEVIDYIEYPNESLHEESRKIYEWNRKIGFYARVLEINLDLEL